MFIQWKIKCTCTEKGGKNNFDKMSDERLPRIVIKYIPRGRRYVGKTKK